MPSVLNSKHNFIFFHTPKTGGSSVSEHLWRFCSGSAFLYWDKKLNSIDLSFDFMDSRKALWAPFRTPSEWQDILGGYYKDAFTFSIMRNPFTWLESAFWWHKNNLGSLPFVHHKAVSPWIYLKDPYEAFEAFIDSYNTPTQVYYLQDSPDEDVPFDWVGDYDELETCYRLLSAQFGFDYCPLHRNNSREKEQAAIKLYRNHRVITKAECLLNEDIKLYKKIFNKTAEPE